MTKEEFKTLFDNHFDALRNYIYYRSGDLDLSTDIAQETFLKIWDKQISVFPGKEKGLLYKIAGDLFLSQIRRIKMIRRKHQEYRFDMHSQTLEDEFQFEELKHQYEKALAQLPEKQRVVFLMSRMDQLKYHEIADALNLSMKAVEKRMKNALDYLKTELKRH